MNTLKIIETSGITESIPFRIISKLYNLLKDSNTQSDSYNLQGRLESRREYKTHTTFLTSKFNRLYINISDEYYVEFADSNVEKEMIRLFGDDGIGVIVSNVNATYLHSTFHKNTMQNIYGTDDINWQIKSFNELSQFTSIKTLDAECFVYQYALESIDLTNITKLGRANFLGCDNLKTLGDTSNIVSITGESNFLNCSSLTSFELSPLLTTIKASTFEGCTSLTSIDLSHVTKIEQSAFKNSGLSGELSLPNLIEVRGNAFTGTNITHVTDLGNITILNSTLSGTLHGPFENCTELISCVLPSTCTKLDGGSFNGCTKLTTIIGGENITYFNSRTFSGCTKLESLGSIDLSKITKIGEFDFRGCSSLNINLNLSSLQFLGAGAFYECSQITKILSLGSITTTSTFYESGANRGVFEGCTNLQSVNLPSSLLLLNSRTFCGCTSLTTINLENISNFGAECFRGCTSLTTVDLSGCTQLNNVSVFQGCTSLTTVDLSNITEFAASCFNGCTGLTHVDFPEIFYCKQSNKGQEFYNCTSLGNGETLELTLGSNLGANTFRNTKYNKLILHANSEYQIDNFKGSGQLGSFSYMLNCQICDLSDTVYTYAPKVGEQGENGVLKTIIYPKTVTRCATNFTDCSFKLENIIFLSEEYITPAIDTYWAYMQLTNKANFHIYVKDELLDQYLADNNWGPSDSSWKRSSIFKPWSNIPSDIIWYTKEHTSIFES